MGAKEGVVKCDLMVGEFVFDVILDGPKVLFGIKPTTNAGLVCDEDEEVSVFDGFLEGLDGKVFKFDVFGFVQVVLFFDEGSVSVQKNGFFHYVLS